MASNMPGNLFKRAWYTWKSYSLPWRRHRFAGMDLEGNTYWETKGQLGGARPRRIVRYKDIKRDLVDYKLTPQWHQWLRATRTEPPTILELENDILRIRQLKHNAALADARWAAKPSLINAGPHPPSDSVLESNTKISGDSGLQAAGSQSLGRGEVEADLGGKMVEKKKKVVGESSSRRARGLGGLRDAENPWEDADRKGEFGVGAWDPNKRPVAGGGTKAL